jgi:hypothetical protein
MAPAWIGIVLALLTSVAVLLAGEIDSARPEGAQ